MDEEDRRIILADMRGEWLDEQQSGHSEDTGPQEQVNTYVTMALQLIISYPYASATRVLSEIASVGWTGSRVQIIEDFGGLGVFARTIQRMEPLRAAAVDNRLTGFPVTTRPLGEHALGHETPEIDGYIAWWAPQIGVHDHPFLFSIHQHLDGVLSRYPNEEMEARDNLDEDATEPHQ